MAKSDQDLYLDIDNALTRTKQTLYPVLQTAETIGHHENKTVLLNELARLYEHIDRIQAYAKRL